MAKTLTFQNWLACKKICLLLFLCANKTDLLVYYYSELNEAIRQSDTQRIKFWMIIKCYLNCRLYFTLQWARLEDCNEK
jgi:hypothetical protein